MSSFVGWKPMTINKEAKKMLINTLAEDIRKKRQEIEENAKYYTPQWKRDQLQMLKDFAIKGYQEAIQEVEELNREYENKIREVENTPFSGHGVSSEYLDNVRFTKSRLLAEIRVNPSQKDAIIQRALSTKMGSQALLELIQDKELDNSYWTDEVFKSAFVNSKTQKEIDYELSKATKIEELKTELSGMYDYGSYLAAVKIAPSIEREFVVEIASVNE